MMTDRRSTIAGLLVGAAGIAMLWAAGVAFPVVVPPGIVILVVGAAVVATVRRPWASAVGAGLGLFVIAGFLISPTGIPNLRGESGVAVALGQAVQVVGVTAAAVTGYLAFRRERQAVAVENR